MLAERILIGGIFHFSERSLLGFSLQCLILLVNVCKNPIFTGWSKTLLLPVQADVLECVMMAIPANDIDDVSIRTGLPRHTVLSTRQVWFYQYRREESYAHVSTDKWAAHLTKQPSSVDWTHSISQVTSHGPKVVSPLPTVSSVCWTIISGSKDGHCASLDSFRR